MDFFVFFSSFSKTYTTFQPTYSSHGSFSCQFIILNYPCTRRSKIFFIPVAFTLLGPGPGLPTFKVRFLDTFMIEFLLTLFFRSSQKIVIECGDDIYKIAPRPPTSVILANTGGSNNSSYNNYRGSSSPIHEHQSTPERQRVNTPSPNPSLVDIPLNSPDSHHSSSTTRSKSNDHLNEAVMNDDVARNNTINTMSSVPSNNTGNNNVSNNNSKSRSSQDTKVLLIANHQSTGDVPLMFQAFSTSNHYILLWIMDHQFKYTNFGIVSATHGDYFIKPRNFVKSELTKHCLNAPEKDMILLFPEGMGSFDPLLLSFSLVF